MTRRKKDFPAFRIECFFILFFLFFNLGGDCTVYRDVMVRPKECERKINKYQLVNVETF